VTCSDFSSGTAPDLTQGSSLVKGTAIHSVQPGVFFYCSKVVAPFANFTMTVNESNVGSYASRPPIPPQRIG
jgi:hypothetical protein